MCKEEFFDRLVEMKDTQIEKNMVECLLTDKDQYGTILSLVDIALIIGNDVQKSSMNSEKEQAIIDFMEEKISSLKERVNTLEDERKNIDKSLSCLNGHYVQNALVKSGLLAYKKSVSLEMVYQLLKEKKSINAISEVLQVSPNTVRHRKKQLEYLQKIVKQREEVEQTELCLRISHVENEYIKREKEQKSRTPRNDVFYEEF